jgi:diguanylate cyclase
MTSATGALPKSGARAPDRSDRRVTRRSRAASVGLVLVLLAVSIFALWSSYATSSAAGRAVAANRLSDDYADAASAVAAEESLGRKYRLEPSLAIRTSHSRAGTALVAALANVRKDGDASDRVVVEQVLVEHGRYVAATTRLFAAVDRSDIPTATRIDSDEADPSFGLIEKLVGGGAEDKHQVALAELADLEHRETVGRRSTPLVFLAGLLLALLLVSVTRGHRRQLDTERAWAVHDSLHDGLTGLPNRILFADRVDQALRAGHRVGTGTGLLLIDLDRFKDINDTFGHNYGDELLAQVGPRLGGVLREVDTVARLGGDEFAVLLPDIHTVEDATAVATKLAAVLETPFQVEGVVLDVEASIGVVLSGEHGEDATTLLQHADIAMYVAKTHRIGVSVYDPVADSHSPAKVALLGDLRRALERGELILHYQPKVSIGRGDVVGAEALVRWQHPNQGLVFPDAFIPLAEHTGLIGPLTRYVLDAALARARIWADAGHPLPVSVNLSARNLLDEHLADQIVELLALHGVPADLLEIEVTESAIMTDPAKARLLLEQLDTLGVGISIDDFGAGYTSLGQLKYLPVSELKIDRSFVMTMTEDSSNAMIVRSVIELGHNLGLTIVAEGVETEQALTALADIGCDVAQGYHLSRPLAAGDFDTWFAERRSGVSMPRAGMPMVTRALPVPTAGQ